MVAMLTGKEKTNVMFYLTKSQTRSVFLLFQSQSLTLELQSCPPWPAQRYVQKSSGVKPLAFLKMMFQWLTG